GAHKFSRFDQPAILAAQPDRAAPFGVDRRDELLVDRSGEDHLDHFYRLAVGDPQSVYNAAFDTEALQHLADLRAPAVHADRFDADLLEEDDVARERIANLSIPHRVAAVFDDQGAAGVAPHIRQRLRQNRGLDRRIRVWDLLVRSWVRLWVHHPHTL